MRILLTEHLTLKLRRWQRIQLHAALWRKILDLGSSWDELIRAHQLNFPRNLSAAQRGTLWDHLFPSSRSQFDPILQRL